MCTCLWICVEHAKSIKLECKMCFYMDFVLGLPRNQREKMDTMLVVVGCFSKMTHFISCKNRVDASDVAKLYILRSCAFAWSSKFVSNFWKYMWESLGTKLQFSNSYYPQIDVISRSLGNGL